MKITIFNIIVEIVVYLYVQTAQFMKLLINNINLKKLEKYMTLICRKLLQNL